MSERKPILVIRNVCDAGPIQAEGRIRLYQQSCKRPHRSRRSRRQVGDTFNAPIEITVWNKFIMDQFDANHSRPKFGGLSNPRFDRDGPVASLIFESVN